MEIKGKISKILPLQSGISNAGKEWKKQEVILKQLDKYETEVCITAFGNEELKKLEGFNIGDTVEVSVNIKSNEFNGRYFTNINSWRWNNKNSESNEGFATSDDNDMPF
tara:strand:+ start:70 stop:396 length:327 start_codon:yes stop_codon:yes gene_type:complete